MSMIKISSQEILECCERARDNDGWTPKDERRRIAILDKMAYTVLYTSYPYVLLSIDDFCLLKNYF